MKEPQLIIIGGKRPRGRPVGSTRVTEPGSSVSAWVPESLHDKAVAVAARREISISQLIKEALSITVGVDER